jgi:hypothetical protein
MELERSTATARRFTNKARRAAAVICANPSVLQLSSDLQMPKSTSSLVFIRPHREPSEEEGQIKIGPSGEAIPFIPTKHLSEIFEEQRVAAVSNEQSLQLFYVFSSHAFARTSAGWIHEQKMHRLLCSGGAPAPIFRDGQEMGMSPSTNLLPGTVAGLESVGASNSFYWIPCVANFEGIDGVLGDTDGNIYAVQAITADDHRNPKGGLKRVWEKLRPGVRTRRTWHFVVVVAKDRTVAEKCVKQFSEELDGDSMLGPPRVTVWGCVLPQ